MSKPLTVLELKAEINAWKNTNCPKISGMKKKDLIKVAERLGVKRTRADPKVYKEFGVDIPEERKAKSTLTKKQLIAKITAINGRNNMFYKDWDKVSLQQFYEDLK